MEACGVFVLHFLNNLKVMASYRCKSMQIILDLIIFIFFTAHSCIISAFKALYVKSVLGDQGFST